MAMMTVAEILRLTQKGQINEALTEALADVNDAVRTAGQAGELTLKIKIIPDANGGRLTSMEFDVAVKTPRRKLPKGVFWMADDGGLLRNDPDQAEMFEPKVVGSDRPYTPPAEASGG